MATYLSTLKMGIRGILGLNDADSDKVTAMFACRDSFAVSSVTATNAHGTLTKVFPCIKAMNLKAAGFLLNGTTLAAAATNNAQLQLSRLATDGSTTTLVGYTASNAAVTNSVMTNLTLVATNTAFAAGESLCVQWVKGDITTTGLAVSAGVLGVYTEEVD